jgi:hypothetical protein
VVFPLSFSSPLPFDFVPVLQSCHILVSSRLPLTSHVAHNTHRPATPPAPASLSVAVAALSRLLSNRCENQEAIARRPSRDNSSRSPSGRLGTFTPFSGWWQAAGRGGMTPAVPFCHPVIAAARTPSTCPTNKIPLVLRRHSPACTLPTHTTSLPTLGRSGFFGCRSKRRRFSAADRVSSRTDFTHRRYASISFFRFLSKIRAIAIVTCTHDHNSTTTTRRDHYFITTTVIHKQKQKKLQQQTKWPLLTTNNP